MRNKQKNSFKGILAELLLIRFSLGDCDSIIYDVLEQFWGIFETLTAHFEQFALCSVKDIASSVVDQLFDRVSVVYDYYIFLELYLSGKIEFFGYDGQLLSA
jgi:hypothetical protein